MKWVNNIRAVAIVVLSLACVAGCSRKPAPPPIRIALAHDAGFEKIADSIAAAATNSGFEVIRMTNGANLSTQNVDAIVLCPDDRRMDPGSNPVFTVDFDNRGAGKLAANVMNEALGGTGKVAILDHPELDSAILRTRGFQERLNELKATGDVDIEVAAQLPGGRDARRGFSATQTFLMAQGGLKGIFAVNQAAAAGARKALAEAEKIDQIALVAFNETGTTDGNPTIVPDTENVGTNTVTAIQQVLEGQPVESDILIPMKLLPQVVPTP